MPVVVISVDAVQGNTIRVTDAAQVHHLRDVRRLRPGELVECVDGRGGRYEGRLARQGAKELVIGIQARRQETPPPCSVTLALALIESERFEWMLEKATELGAARIRPEIAQRSIVRLAPERVASRLARWRRIVMAAAQQCGRAWLPLVDEPVALKQAIHELENIPALSVPPDDGGATKPMGAHLSVMATLVRPGEPLTEVLGRRHPKTVVVFIGPEGDFTPEEVDAAMGQGTVPVALGPLTLRAETAALAALVAIQLDVAHWEGMDSRHGAG